MDETLLILVQTITETTIGIVYEMDELKPNDVISVQRDMSGTELYVTTANHENLGILIMVSVKQLKTEIVTMM